jgi:hypothetical protein
MTAKNSLLGLGVSLAFIAVLLAAPHAFRAVPEAGAQEAPFAALGEQYTKEVRPLLRTFCVRCHSAKKPEGDVNLEACATLADVRKATRAWLKVVEMLDTAQMPPRE